MVLDRTRRGYVGGYATPRTRPHGRSRIADNKGCLSHKSQSSGMGIRANAFDTSPRSRKKFIAIKCYSSSRRSKVPTMQAVGICRRLKQRKAHLIVIAGSTDNKREWRLSRSNCTYMRIVIFGMNFNSYPAWKLFRDTLAPMYGQSGWDTQRSSRDRHIRLLQIGCIAHALMQTTHEISMYGKGICVSS